MTERGFSVGGFVAARIRQLLGDNPAHPSSTSRALLAQLRAAADKEPGTVPAIWAVATEGIPERASLEAERAIHIALTQFAMHQQSRDASMHEPSQKFGRAIRLLAQKQVGPDKEIHETPAYQRFTALARSTQLAALLAHSRGLIMQLRSESIPFDYDRYAHSLYCFQFPARADSVRRQWGRDFHQLIPEIQPQSETTTQEKED